MVEQKQKNVPMKASDGRTVRQPSGMYGETPKINVGDFRVCLMGGTGDGLWIESNDGEGGQFHGPCLEDAIKRLWDEHF